MLATICLLTPSFVARASSDLCNRRMLVTTDTLLLSRLVILYQPKHKHATKEPHLSFPRLVPSVDYVETLGKVDVN